MKEGWEYKKLGEVADVAAGQGAPQGETNYCSDGIPFIKAGNLEALINGLQEQEIQKVSAEVVKSHRLKLYKAGSVLFAKSGMSCMKGWVYTLKNDCYVVSHLAIITPQNIKHGFLNYYFQFNKPNTLIKDAAYPSISLKDISNMLIPCPSLSEQQHIVEELDLLSSIIEKKKAQLNELDNLSQSLFYEMFGDPSNWEGKRLKDIMTKMGSGATPRGGNQSYKEEGVSLIRSLNVHNGYFKYEDLAHIDEQQASQLDNVTIEENDVLLNITGASVARCCIVPNDILPARVNQHVSILRAKNNILNSVYLCYYLISKNTQEELILISKSNAATREALPKSTLEKYTVPIPPLDLQNQFASKIEAIEHQKELIKQSIKEVETLFNSRMDYYFN